MESNMIKTNRDVRFVFYLTYIIPAFYLLLGFYFRHVFGDLSLRSNDPEYIHFISGMCISTGQFDQANIDHPGSIIQILLALVFKAVYFFRKGDLPYFEDAMINSDLYLSVGNLTITTILAITILWAGMRSFKVTGNVFYALLLQLSPLLLNIWYEIIGRIYPELLILIPILILQVQFLELIYGKKQNSGWRNILVFSIAIAFGMSLKMTFLPFVIIPLIVIKPWLDKLKFVGSAAILFLLFALPVTFQLERFWNWMRGIFLHSGSYQSGDKNIINLDLFLENFSKILVEEWAFFVAIALLAICLIIYIFKKQDQEKRRNVLIRITLSLLFVFGGMTFIISKQFAIRYFLPALLFFPFLLVLILENLSEFFAFVNRFKVFLSMLILFLGLHLLYNKLPYMRVVSNSIEGQMTARKNTRSVINTLKPGSYKIIVSQDYGCPFHEYAIMHSFCVAGRGWPNYKEKLDKIYPNTYQYFTWDNTIKYWGQDFNPDEIIESGKQVYLYLQKNNKELYNKTIAKLFGDSSEFAVENELIFQNPKNEEGILQLYISRSEKNELDTSREEI